MVVEELLRGRYLAKSRATRDEALVSRYKLPRGGRKLSLYSLCESRLTFLDPDKCIRMGNCVPLGDSKEEEMIRHAKALVLLTAILMLPLLVQAQDASSMASPDKQAAMAKLQNMSAQLNLTPDQKKQMLPIMMEEASKMKALKSDTSLGPLQKAMQMKQLGADMDAKVKPILNPDQYQKFEAMRQQEREQMIQKMRAGKQQ